MWNTRGTCSYNIQCNKKCGCPFKIRSISSKDGSGWKIDVKFRLHDHDLPNTLEGHLFVGRLSSKERQHVSDLTKCHVPPKHILFSLQ